MSKISREKLIGWLWNILPFIITAGAVWYLLNCRTTDTNYFYIFISFVIIILLPFSAAVVCMIRAIVLAQILGIALNSKTSEPQLRKLSQKAEKWMAITLFNALGAFLIISLMAIGSVKAERKKAPLQIVKINQPKRMSEGSEVDKDLYVLDIIVRHLWKVSLSAIGIAIVLILALIILKKIPLEKPGPATKFVMFTAGGMFIVPIIAGFMISGIMEKLVLREVRFFLKNASPAAKAAVRGRPVDNGAEIIKALEKIAPVPMRRSNYTKKFRVEITDGEEGLIVDLGRDASYGNEYWVFYPGYGYTLVNEIGRIRTNLFDEY